MPVGEGEDANASSPSIHLKETKHLANTLLALLVLKLASVLAFERVPETLTQDQLILTFKPSVPRSPRVQQPIFFDGTGTSVGRPGCLPGDQQAEHSLVKPCPTVWVLNVSLYLTVKHY